MIMLSPTVRVDNEVYVALQTRALAFVDTPNSVMRRVLGLDPEGEFRPLDDLEEDADDVKATAPRRSTSRQSPKKQSPRRGRKGAQKRPRALTGSVLAEDEYVLPLLTALQRHGGVATARQVIGSVGEALDGRLTELDREKLSSGALRWANRVQFVRLRLIQEGLMSKDSPRGTWEITDAGRKRVADLDGKDTR